MAPPMPAAGMGTVLVLGARGRLGYACVQAFAQAGWQVLAHVRRGSALARHAPPMSARVDVRWLDGDLSDTAACQALLRSHGPVDVVVNTMASGGSSRAAPPQLLAVAQQGIDLARHAQALLMAPLTVLPYGRQIPDVLYEGAVLPDAAPDSLIQLGRARAAADQLLAQAAATGLQVCTLRAGTYYGLAGKDWISTTIAASLRQGRMRALGPLDLSMSWAYLPDLASSLERLARQRRLLGPLTALHFAGQQRTGREWHQALTAAARQQGWLAPQRELKVQALRWGWWTAQGGWAPHRRRLAELEYLWNRSFQLDNRQLQSLIGPEPRTPWATSVDAAVQRLFAG